jgi:hypothetical protein
VTREIPIEEVYDLREDLKFAEGRWLDGSTIPVAPDYPILGIVTYAGPDLDEHGVYTILIWENNEWNVRYIHAGLSAIPVGIQHTLSGATITRWKELSSALPGSGLRAEYYYETSLSGSIAYIRLENLNHAWLTAGPVPGISANTPFSVRWNGYLKVPITDDYRFRVTCDDTLRLYLGDDLYLDALGPSTVRQLVTNVTTLAQGYQPITVEFVNLSGSSSIKLEWEDLSTPGFQTIPVSSLFIPSYVN